MNSFLFGYELWHVFAPEDDANDGEGIEGDMLVNADTLLEAEHRLRDHLYSKYNVLMDVTITNRTL